MKYNLEKSKVIGISICLVVIILGFALMTGEPSGAEYNPDIFSFRRITVGPMISLAGFVGMIAAILWKKHE